MRYLLRNYGTWALSLILFLMVVIPLKGIALKGEGDSFPQFRIKEVGGGYLTLDKMIGEKPVIISFWATWCKPCKKELKWLKKLYKKYNQNCFQVLAVSEDGRTRRKVPSFVKRFKLDYKVAYDTNYRLKQMLGISDIPELFIINKQGKIVYHHSGYQPGDEKKVEEELKKLVGPPDKCIAANEKETNEVKD